MMATVLLVSFCICLIFISLGFKKTVWFISLGYTFSIAALCLTLIVFHYDQFHLWNWLQLIGVLSWALRLGYFLFEREKNELYNQAVSIQTNASQGQSISVKFAIWIGVAILYSTMFFPAEISIFESAKTSHFPWHQVGVVILWAGVVLEAVADNQKSTFKKKYPNSFTNTGLYKFVRSPNYLGEILVWTGNILVAVPYFGTWWHWVIALFGWICIVLIMMGSTKRLEKKHDERYGEIPDYQIYKKTTPILFPWLPIYSFRKLKVYLG